MKRAIQLIKRPIKLLLSTALFVAIPFGPLPILSGSVGRSLIGPSGAAGGSTESTIAVAAATTFYVDGTSGSDANPGTQALPWKTIQKAANTLQAGQTVVVAGGQYNERVHVTTSGTAGAPIVFQGAFGLPLLESLVPDASAPGSASREGTGSPTASGTVPGTVIMQGFTVEANYITIKGFEITNTPDDWQDGVGIWVQGSYCDLEDNYVHFATRGGIRLNVDYGKDYETSQCIVRNNRLYRNSQWGLMVMGSNNLIEGNEIWASIQYHPAWINPPSTVDADGIRFSGGGHTFRGNYIHDISYRDPYNVNPHIDCFQTWVSSTFEAGYDSVFERNLCVNLETSSTGLVAKGFMLSGASALLIRNNVIRAYYAVYAENSRNLTIVNNTLTYDLLNYSGGWAEGVQLAGTPGSIVENNIFYDFPGYAVQIWDTASTLLLTVGHNLTFRSDGKPAVGSPYPGDLWNVDPLFVSASRADFHLTCGSPAAGAGLLLSMVNDDFDGRPRDQTSNYDLGAYLAPPYPDPAGGMACPGSEPSSTMGGAAMGPANGGSQSITPFVVVPTPTPSGPGASNMPGIGAPSTP